MVVPREMIEIVSFGDLVESGSYRVHSRFARVVNMTDHGRFVSLVTPSVDAGPLNIVVRGVDLSGVGSLTIATGAATPGGGATTPDGGEVSLRPGWTITLDGRRIPLEGGRVYKSVLDFQPHSLPLFTKNLSTLGLLLAEQAPEKSLAFLLDSRRLVEFRDGFERAVVDHIGHSVRDILHGNTLRGVGRLKGCGFGLTPSGDDFIVGLLIATHVLERSAYVGSRPVVAPGASSRRGAAGSVSGRDLTLLRTRILETARSGNVLSDTFLYLAEGGFLTEGIKNLVAALSFGSSRDVRRCAEHLFAVGATSGADTAVGLQMTLMSWPARSSGATVGRVTGTSVQDDREAQWS